MIKSKRLLANASLMGMITLASCSLSKMTKMAKDQELTVNPNPLEVHADTIKFDMTAKLPLKMLKKNKTYTAQAFYVYGGERKEVGNIEFRSEDYPDAKNTQPTASQSFAFPYEEGMKRGNLVVVGTAANVNGKSRSTDDFPVATGAITTSRLVQDFYMPAYAPHEYNNQPELTPTYVEFYFPQGSSQLRTSEVRSSRGRFLDAFIADKNATRSVTIVGTHSPEGEERINARLADDRAQVMEDFYKRQMRRYDYKDMADSIRFIRKAVVENWDSLKVALDRDQKLTSAQKDEIRGIINPPGSFEEQEKSLRSLSTYDYLLNTIYPDLRTAQTEILTIKEKKTDAEIATLAQGIASGSVSADTLNDAELGYAATLTPRLEEKERIYQAATKKNGSWQSHNNLGAVYLQMALGANDRASRATMIDRANNQFEISKSKKESPEVLANAAVAQLLNDDGQARMALESLKRAEQMNPGEQTRKAINATKGAIEIRMANYGAAASSLGNAVDTSVVYFNRGLAELLNKNASQARASFDEAIEADADMAVAYYGAAIAAARQKNENQVTQMLRQAIQKDSNLRARAVDDIEFRDYFESQSFKDAIR